MVDPARGEACAHGEAGVTCPDDDGRRRANGNAPGYATFTVTLVGLVMMS